MRTMLLLNSKTQILIIILVKMICANTHSEEGQGMNSFVSSVESKEDKNSFVNSIQSKEEKNPLVNNIESKEKNSLVNNMESKEGKSSFVKLLKNIVDINEKRVVAMKKLSHLQDFIYTKNTLAKVHDFEFDEDSSEDLRDQHAILTQISMRKNVNISLRSTKNNKPNENINIIPFNSFNIKSRYMSGTNKQRDDTIDVNHYKTDNIKYKVNIFNRDIDEDTIVTEDKGVIYKEDLAKIYPKVYRIPTNFKDNKENVKKNDDEDDFSNTRKSWSRGCDKKASKLCKRACVEAYRNGCMIYKCSRRAKKAFKKECKRSCRSMFLTGQYSDSESE